MVVQTYVTKENGKRRLPFNEQRLRDAIKRDVGDIEEHIIEKIIRQITRREEVSVEHIRDLIVKELVAEIDIDKANYTFKASRAYLAIMYKLVSKHRDYDVKDTYLDYYSLVRYGVENGLYHEDLLNKYTPEELEVAGMYIEKDRDKLFDFAGLSLLEERYLLRNENGDLLELPQERFLTIALWLMQDESRDKRMVLVKNAYDAMSKLYLTTATPTLANAGKTHGQLASCNIEVWDDSLDGIFTANHNIARQSKGGAGWGLYVGKLRSRGSSIKNFKDRASGVMPFLKIVNSIAVAVDQLGTRNGSIAVYLDVWHKDINAFLDMKLNNGDSRLRNHDLFHGVTLPDLFMEQVEKRGEWHLFDPHEIRQKMGFNLEDYYDEEFGNGSFREKYQMCVDNEDLSRTTVPAIDIMKRIMISQLETGSPFMFYRDEVNRDNPNKHEGMIYSSNLCTEIAQNTSASIIKEEVVKDDNGDTVIARKMIPGDLVTCNLSSLNLGKLIPQNDEDGETLEKTINIQMRMLDNVVDLNKMDVEEANVTAQRYRAVGAGKFGTHHLLALKGIEWDSNEATEYIDEIEELISYYTIKASMKLAKEKGAYPLFEGSEWQTGEHLARRGYFEGRTKVGVDEWLALNSDIKRYGLRNGYLQSPAPNGSTATIAGSTEASDPVFDVLFYEEKKNYKLPRVAPDLDHTTYQYYRTTAYKADQRYSVQHNIARQRHIDQAISFNYYVPNTIRASILLDLHLQAWRGGMKTSYYVRSTATDIQECEWCMG